MKTMSIGVCVLLLSACSSIVEGDRQIMSLDTPSCGGAKCELVNEQGAYYLSETPGTIMINKSASTMKITCEKADAKQEIFVESHTAGMTFGNILAGGVIGAAVDMSTGAAYKYPEKVDHPLTCED